MVTGPRLEVSVKNINENDFTQLHMPSFNYPKLKSCLLVEPAKTDPVMQIDIPVLQFGDIFAGRINIAEKGALFWYHCCVFGKHVHDESSQSHHVRLISIVLFFPLIIDVGQEIAVLKVVIQIPWIPIVLRRYQPALHEIAPCVAFQYPGPTLAHPVLGRALPEFADAVVLASKGHQILHSRIVAALDIRSEELPALREAQRIDSRSFGKYGVRGQVVAHLLDLQGQVTEKSGSAVIRRVRVKADVIGGGIANRVVEQFANGP